jgi:7-carboxy-7-deazaguanine synthase
MQIIEIYKSLQGESSYAGLPCIFVRLAGCNLRCAWCDSEYTFKGGSRMTQEEIEAEVRRLSPNGGLVEITGGEPLLQEEVYPLMERLLASGRTVMLETGGHRSTARVPAAVLKIVDVKCPGSGEAARNDWSNLDRLEPHDEVKFVVQDRADYEYARDVIARHDLASRTAAVLISPVHGVLDPKILSEWMLADRLPARLQMQLHKYIWTPSTRGV